MRKTIYFYTIFLSCVIVFGVFMIAIGTRIENADLTPPKPDQIEVSRQDLAEQTERIKLIATELSQAELAKAAGEWGKDLGGVWIPWPAGAPKGYENPPLDIAVDSPDFPTVVSELNDFAEKVLELPAPDTHYLTTTISTAAREWADQIATKAGIASGDESISIANISTAITSAEEITALETARQWIEFNTAQLPLSERTQRYEIVDQLNAIINDALARDIPDERTQMVEFPTTKDRPANLIESVLMQPEDLAKLEVRRAIAQFLSELAQL